MQESVYAYKETKPAEIVATFADAFKNEDGSERPLDLSRTADLLMLTSIAGPKEKKWNAGSYVPSTRVTKKSRAEDIYRENQGKTRDFIITLMVEQLEIGRGAGCDLYRHCEENKAAILFGQTAAPEPDADEDDEEF